MRLLLSLLALSLLSPPSPSPPRLECATPARLRLHRFEDGSARLECGRRTIARISVPG